MPQTKPPYPAAFREQIVQLARAGRSAVELSREFGPSAQSIGLWVAKAAELDGLSVGDGAKALSGEEREELVRLRRQLKQVQQERDILAKATAWFAGKSEQTFKTSTES
jgi:transposase